MNHKLLLALAAISTLTGSMLMLLLTEISHATEASLEANFSELAICSVPVEPKNQSDIGIQSDTTIAAIPTATPTDDDLMMDFTIEESDAAVALFGCDCPPCINALRQLRNQTLSQSFSQALLSNNEGHCWNALQRRSPQETQEMLQNLETES